MAVGVEARRPFLCLVEFRNQAKQKRDIFILCKPYRI
jgi:hypothetical protein